MRIVILAAGYAVRLQPLTLTTSKSLLKIAGRTILDRIFDRAGPLKGVTDPIVVVVNAKFFSQFEGWRKSSGADRRIMLVNDGSESNETRLGAIMDLELAIEQGGIDDDLLVIAGDNLFEFDLGGFVRFAAARSDCVSVAVYDIKDRVSARSFGVMTIGRDKKVVEFEEKPAEPKSTLVSTGVYYFPKDTLSLIRQYAGLGEKLDAPGYYISWLCKKNKVYGYAFGEEWYDIGNIDSYDKANARYLEKEK